MSISGGGILSLLNGTPVINKPSQEGVILLFFSAPLQHTHTYTGVTRTHGLYAMRIDLEREA